MAYPALLEGQRKFDQVDECYYVPDTIHWFIEKGDIVPSRHKHVVHRIHTFDLNHFCKFICREIIYVADTATESYYQVGHPKNAGAEVAGTVVVDLTFLKRDGLIEKTMARPDEYGKNRYVVEFDLIIETIGRNMHFTAKYPHGEEGKALTMLDGSKRQISVAAAFEPGTK